ncbi:A disintegrin and metalloproteinase with thrombospondin motifs 18-like isoform X3 [Leptopilina boulardi]|uniref:A disintegrin and metalloproteinase with thrombospondin motifs 18-like isoform X3 n=1 Tax=Leptopilina boulardi TaxID=63433 RepID=UPI0021F654A1|nr:A disintegrin and metalloproteinase with thrombospondin motifs 18-like isoform X3 [Leptopilina boulardi]
MIYICILIYAFLAPTFTFEVHQNFDDYFLKQSHTSDKVSDYEVISVEHSIHKRSTNQISIKLKNENGTERELILQSVEDFFTTKETNVWTARKYGNKFKYTPQKEVMEKVNITFYQDEKTQSTITHTVNKRGISEFNGVIDSDKVIRPLNNYIRKRRNVLSDVIYKSENIDSTKNYHVVYKRVSTAHFKEFNNYDHILKKSNHRMKRSILNAPNTVYPEILVYVDKTLFESFNNDIVKTVAYTLTFWNGVDLYFRDLKNPSVRLSIAGIVLCQDQFKMNNPFIITESYMALFQQFMYMENKFKLGENYDIAVLLGANPKVYEKNGEILGLATAKGVCQTNHQFYMTTSTAIIMDDVNFMGISSAAHEFGHLFGAPHDGSRADFRNNIPGAESCPFNEGFIMSYKTNNKNRYFFSQCSKDIISSYLSQDVTKCLRNNPAINRTDKQILRILPGKYKTVDEQCQSKGYSKAYSVDENICTNIRCHAKFLFFSYSKEIQAALEGTSCGLGKICLRGECVKLDLDEIEATSIANTLFYNVSN